MNRTLLILISLLFFAIFIFSSCGEQSIDNEPIESVEFIDKEILNIKPDPDSPRYAEYVKALDQPKILTSIDTTKFALHIRDYYWDWFYLNPIGNSSSPDMPTDYYAYAGYFVVKGVKYKASLIYSKKTKSLSVGTKFDVDRNMAYHCHAYSYNYFVGTYHIENYVRQYPVTCKIMKGELPGSNI